MNMVRFGSDFSGVGAANQALKRLGISYEEVFACEIDKYARQTYILNYGEPTYYSTDVYDRLISDKPLDLYVTTPPCQSFSMAGLRGGESDERGVLFYNSHEFIKKNKPKFFVIENVKGLLSVDEGTVFARWIDYLAGKSINGLSVLFPHQESVPYHIFWSVLNAKDYNVPQNRERVFIVGIRDDEDLPFRFPKAEKLRVKLADILERDVDDKYYLSERLLHYFKNRGGDFGGRFSPIEVGASWSGTLMTGYSGVTNTYLKDDKGLRRFTPRECFRLMDFPDSFNFSVVSDTQAYKQAGNSVVVKMYEIIFRELFKKT